MSEFEFVQSGNGSAQLAAIENADIIGIDTEFMREKTFYAQLCLVQISTQDTNYCIDPLQDDDLAYTWDVLMSRQWVLHSGRQDMEVLYQATNRFSPAVFDTQIAAGLLGYAPQVGYANLVETLFDVRLDKSQTRSDWSRRPLPELALAYAAEDVAYLLPARERLLEDLDKLGRVEWALEDSADLQDKSLYENTPELAINRLKGARNLQGPARATAAGLATWRENQALRRNLPRQWIMRDAVVLEMAERRPGTIDELSLVSGISEKTIARRGAELLDIVATSKVNDVSYHPPSRPNETQKAKLKKAQSIVATCAEDLGVAAEIIAPKKELSAALFGPGNSRVFRGWRRELIGNDLLEVLSED